MSWSLLDLQNQIANEMDQSATAPTQGGTDWNIRLNALNRAQIDWAESYDWEVLKRQFNGLISTSTGNASVAVPLVRKPDGLVQIGSDFFTPVNSSRNVEYLDTVKIVNFIGNDRDARVMYVRGVSLSSGASVQFNYWKSPVSLSTATDISECPDPTYLVQRGLYYLYKGREDGRFPEAKVESEKILARMIEQENTLGIGHSDNQVHSYNQSLGYRIGRD